MNMKNEVVQKQRLEFCSHKPRNIWCDRKLRGMRWESPSSLRWQLRQHTCDPVFCPQRHERMDYYSCKLLSLGRSVTASLGSSPICHPSPVPLFCAQPRPHRQCFLVSQVPSLATCTQHPTLAHPMCGCDLLIGLSQDANQICISDKQQVIHTWAGIYLY